MKRIIKGQAYNTETSTTVFVLGHASGHTHWQSDGWFGLYQTRLGAFFKIMMDHDGETLLEFEPISDIEAQELTEKYANHLVEKFFDVIEGGSAERRLTVRLPINLARRVEEAALTKSISVNTYAMRALESAVTKDGHPPTGNESLLRPRRRGKAVSKRLQERAGQKR
jgi:hypothetical protein